MGVINMVGGSTVIWYGKVCPIFYVVSLRKLEESLLYACVQLSRAKTPIASLWKLQKWIMPEIWDNCANFRFEMKESSNLDSLDGFENENEVWNINGSYKDSQICRSQNIQRLTKSSSKTMNQGDPIPRSMLPQIPTATSPTNTDTKYVNSHHSEVDEVENWQCYGIVNAKLRFGEYVHWRTESRPNSRMYTQPN